jgi:hypothetical protein
VWERLAKVLTGGRMLPSVWLTALSIIIHTVREMEWAGRLTQSHRNVLTLRSCAGSGTPMRVLLEYMIDQIMTHVVLKKGHRLAPSNSISVREAFASNASNIELLENEPLSSTLVAYAALHFYKSNTTANKDHYVRCMRVALMNTMVQVACCSTVLLHRAAPPISLAAGAKRCFEAK